MRPSFQNKWRGGVVLVKNCGKRRFHVVWSRVRLSKILVLFQVWMILVAHSSSNTAASMEGDALYSLRSNLLDPNNVLQSWDPKVGNPCTWFHVTCNSGNSVTRVDLGNAALSGELVPELGQLKNLQYLKLFNNNITGQIPSALGNLTNLVSLDLYLNSITGPIPDSLGNLTKLLFLRLSNNSLSGPIPMSLTAIMSLEVLDLSNNRLSGPVPDNGSFSLVTPISFANNSDLCGPVTGKPCPGSPPIASPPPFVPPATVSSPGENSPTAAIAGGVAAGAALLFAALAVGFAYWRQRKPRGYFFDVPEDKDPEVQLGQLKRFSLLELQVATNNFSEENILGIGGFSKVYKGRLADGTVVAVKRLKKNRTRDGELEFQAEVKINSMVVHRHLLPLRGFCMDPTERLLVYPCMANGSVASHLRELITGRRPLDLARLAEADDVMLLDWVRLPSSERPKMSQVVRMLEGDGLEEKWEEWQEGESVHREGVAVHQEVAATTLPTTALTATPWPLNHSPQPQPNN
ncbi:hypothetical protein Patl1_27548 [Pistacia atlantica]|uniref:Uncharacterized protein n=1 Tax=Pistacia atlantica TaxID=434234 RepID=A0ACC1BDX1_9ROSI|nr:hypothetical protein Patl1_27548 [Pistacia atlantica]